MKTDRGRIFIVWSGENQGRNLALQVKKQLEHYGFEGIVGGESLEGTIPIGDTIFHEIDSCHNAIILVSQKDDKTLSNNLTLEWGYCHHKFSGREESFLINETTLADFDVLGMNSNQIRAKVDFNDEHSVADAAQSVVSRFVSLQDIEHVGEILHLIDSWAEIETALLDKSVPNIKMSKMILFYSQSGYIFHRELDCIKFLSSFRTKNSQNLSSEIDLAIEYSMLALNMFKSFETDSGRKTTPIFSSLEDSYLSLIKKIQHIEQEFLSSDRLDTLVQHDEDFGSFKQWFLVSIYKNLNYLYLVKSRDPSISKKDSLYYEKQSRIRGEKCIEICSELERDPEDKNYALLCAGYMYRNLYQIYTSSGGTEELAHKYSIGAVEKKRDLKNYVEGNDNMSKQFKEYCEMEFYISLAESLKFCETDTKIGGYLGELSEYCRRVEKEHKRRLASLAFIKSCIQEEEKKAYVFDFDLTIADTIKASAFSYREAFNSIASSAPLGTSNVIKYLSEHLLETYKRLPKPKKTYKVFEKSYLNSFEAASIEIYDDVLPLLKRLKSKDKRIIIFSNRDRATIRRVLENRGIISYVEEIITAEDCKNKRKNPEDLRKKLSTKGITVDQVLYLGDSAEDWDCASRAGMDFVMVDRYQRCQSAKGVRKISSLLEIL